MPKPAVFRNEALQKEFDENGFVKFKMFSPEQIERLRNYYLETQAEHETVVDKRKFHATNDTDNPELIASSDQFIKEVMFEEVDKHFLNYKTIAANYLVKQPSEESELSPHQDLLFVDEEEFYSFNIWVATEPTNVSNGCLRFLPGSHNIKKTIRPLPTYPWIYRSVLSHIPSYLVDVTTEPGDCIVLNHACIHASYPNLSGRTRIAAIMALIPAGADIVHYFLPEGDPRNEVEKYSMTLDDFIHLKGGQRPERAILEESFQHSFDAVDPSDFLKWAEQNIGIRPSRAQSKYEVFKTKAKALLQAKIFKV